MKPPYAEDETIQWILSRMRDELKAGGPNEWADRFDTFLIANMRSPVLSGSSVSADKGTRTLNLYGRDSHTESLELPELSSDVDVALQQMQTVLVHVAFTLDTWRTEAVGNPVENRRVGFPGRLYEERQPDSLGE